MGMELKLIDLAQADQLDACKISLLMGVFTPKNLIHDFLNMTRAIMQSDTAILVMQDEPYIWHESAQGFKAFQSDHIFNLSHYFMTDDVIDSQHIDYQLLSEDLGAHGFQHQQMLAFNLKKNEKSSIGQLMMFDDPDCIFSCPQKIQLIHSLIEGLLRNIELRLDFNNLNELYKQECALNRNKNKFFQIIAHDLRAPFHGLLGFSEILLKERSHLDEDSIQNMAEYLHDTAQSTYNLLQT